MRTADIHWRYLGVVFVLSYWWQLVIWLTSGIDSALFPILMLFPAVVAIGFRLHTSAGFRNVGWGLSRWWYAAPALLTPVAVILAVAALILALDLATLSQRLFAYADGMVEIRQVPLVLGNRSQGLAFFALNFLLSLLLQSCLGGVVSIGEEFGWRGYVQEKLLRRFGLHAGLLVLGVIWGLWHLPIGLMGWNFPDRPILGAFVLTPLSTVFMGVYLGWLYLRSRSIWVPTVAHAAMNLSASVLFAELEMRGDELPLQLSWIGAWGIVAALCLTSLNRARPLLWQADPVAPEATGWRPASETQRLHAGRAGDGWLRAQRRAEADE